MPEINTQPDAPVPHLTPAVEAIRPELAERVATDHLAHLPKMSPTAGVGTQEYVAVNAPAVFALLLGFAGILGLMYAPLVVIALAGVVIAAVGIRQINGSNGTQTGAGIALIGLFLSVAISSFVLTSGTLDFWANRNDKQALTTMCQKFGDDLRDGQYDPAYDLFSQRFKSRVSRAEFVSQMRIMKAELAHASIGGNDFSVAGARWNGLAEFYTDPDSGTVTAQSMIEIFYKQAVHSDPLKTTFRKESVVDASGSPQVIWTIDSIPTLFPDHRNDQ